MGWCERCGRFYVLTTNRTVRRTIGARGTVLDVLDTICPNCLKPNERYDEYGNVVTV